MYAGSISPKAAGKLNAKLAVLRKTRPQKSKMAAFEAKGKDEGSAHKKAEVPSNEINHPTNQKRGSFGRVSKGGSAKGNTAPTSRQINQKPMQGKRWVPGSNVSASNPKTGNTRMKGTIAQSGPAYGGGGRNMQ